MKKGLLLFVAVFACFALTAYAAPTHQGIPIEGGTTTAVKAAPGKAPVGAVAIGPMGYADSWRTIAAAQGKSIISNAAGTDIQVLYGTYSGSAGNPSNLTWGYSDNSGATWNNQTIVSNRNSRTYSGLAVDANFTPYIVWQDRIVSAGWPICLTFDEGGYTAGLWSTAVNLTDSGFMYLPGMAIQDDGAGNFNLFVDAFPHSAFGGNATLHMAHNKAADLSAWTAPWDLSGSWGWKPWMVAPWWDDQDAADFTISPSGDTIVAFWEQCEDTIVGNYRPVYSISTDNGGTWSAPAFFNMAGTDANGHPYQYTTGGWWYRFDGAWIGDKPYFLYCHNAGVWNGNALFIYFPTVAGDYSAWTGVRISEIPGNLAGLNDGDLVGSYADYSTLSYDAAGNIFATYVGMSQGSNAFADIIGVASTDGGNTWLQHVYLTNDGATYDYSFVEAAEYAGGGNMHILAPPAIMDSLYYLTVPTATLLAAPARPREIDLPNLLCGSAEGGVGGPIDAVMDTVNNDTMYYFWSPMIGLNGQYEVTISKTADWSADNYDLASLLDVNYILGVVGMPEAGVVWYYKVRSHFGGETSPWSAVYDFFYNGTATNVVDWQTPSGITGKPVTVTQPFVLNQNRPNPVNNDTKISFNLPKAGEYTLKVYNVAGQVVNNISGRGQAGNNTVSWSSRNVSNGVYFYQLNAAGSTATKKMIVVK
ncbi:MAG: T9SS type A sorting domain-containing protein [Candidatus Edwardsbacteria bacterium]|nr:T9SS type A sorting domain-containing protein [Candidatus Edwardsbacteria bacterium]MBU1577292.1 T9SS type A sorting domain-containing protein [Candidatus Edwardsbacteria bacterium]MBU2462841.1 T9SS type A sorting domain-containing protein [Candidatus Edwardsbacteria bacterium]MBU2594893.1 T9SS type A sorting domain-containing protein [Candidatus Edwardsbacteria bacterium]